MVPSGDALATRVAAMLPPAPEMFSITIGLPRLTVSLSAIDARRDVGRRAGRKADEDMDGGFRVVRLRECGAREQKQRRKHMAKPSHRPLPFFSALILRSPPEAGVSKDGAD